MNTPLEEAGILPNVCFKYDDIYFPYIVLWYSYVYHTWYHQLFYDIQIAIHFYDVLANRAKFPVLYSWSTDKLSYQLSKG